MSVKVIETINLKIKNKNVKSRLGGVSKEGPLLLIQYHSCRQSFFPLLDLQRGCLNAIRNVSPQLSHSDTENIESHLRNLTAHRVVAAPCHIHCITDLVGKGNVLSSIYLSIY